MLGFNPIRKSKKPDLIDLRIASPCPAEWSKMTGTNGVRHCGECNLKVYSFSAMTSGEIEDLVARGGRLCARIYRRADGTMLTEDCPAGLRARVVRRVSRVAGLAVAALMSVHASAWQKVQPKECLPSALTVRHDSGLEITVVDPQDALVPGAQIVMIRKEAGKKKRRGTTSGEGRLILQNLKAGDYTLSVSAKGFRIAESKVLLTDGKMLEVKVKLQIGEVASETVVVAEVPLVMGTTVCIYPVTPSPIPPAMGASRGAVPLRQ